MRSLASLVVLLTLLVGASVAQAATPFTPGAGTRPQIAVDSAGRGHVAWTVPAAGGSPARIGYCRIPAGGSACEVTRTLDFPVPSSGVAAADPQDLSIFTPVANKVVISTACSPCFGLTNSEDAITVFASIDGGTTWSGPGNAGLTPTATGMQGGAAWIDGAGLGVAGPLKGTLATTVEGTSVAGTGVGVPSLAAAVMGAGFTFDPTTVAVPGQTKLVDVANNNGAIHYAVFSGANFNQNVVGNLTNWPVTDQALPSPEPDSAETQLSAGPVGVALTYLQRIPGGDHLLLRRFDATTNTFGPSTPIEGDDPIDQGVGAPDSSQDAAGRLHAVWASGFDTGRLRYVHTDTGLANPTAPADVAQGEPFGEPEVGADAAGAGWAVWDGSGGTIRAVRLEPYAEPTAPPASGGGTTPPPATPSLPATRNVTSTVPGATITFGVPNQCVQPGATFKVTLSWKRKKKKGNKFVKVTRADFYIGTKVVKTDKKAPFVQTLKVTASAKRGSTINLRARAFIKVKKGKAPKKSIKAQIKVCP